MPTQPVFEFRPLPANPAGNTPKPARKICKVVSISDSPAYVHVTEPASIEPVRDGLGCARAIRVAFFVEGGLGVVLYAFWHFRHAISAIHLIH